MFQSIEIEASQLDDEAVKLIPIEDLIRQHRLRYIVTTSKGDVVLRYIGAMRRKTVELLIKAAMPDYDSIRKDLATVRKMIEDFPDATNYKQDRDRLLAKLQPTFYEYYSECFQRPVQMTPEGVVAFLSSLPQNERDLLRMLLNTLITAKPSGDVESEMIILCGRYGIKISDDLTLENMTSQQYAILGQTITDEVKAIKGAHR